MQSETLIQRQANFHNWTSVMSLWAVGRDTEGSSSHVFFWWLPPLVAKCYIVSPISLVSTSLPYGILLLGNSTSLQLKPVLQTHAGKG